MVFGIISECRSDSFWNMRSASPESPECSPALAYQSRSPALARIHQRGDTYDRYGSMGDFSASIVYAAVRSTEGMGTMEQACVGRMVRITHRSSISAVGDFDHASQISNAFRPPG